VDSHLHLRPNIDYYSYTERSTVPPRAGGRDRAAPPRGAPRAVVCSSNAPGFSGLARSLPPSGGARRRANDVPEVRVFGARAPQASTKDSLQARAQRALFGVFGACVGLPESPWPRARGSLPTCVGLPEPPLSARARGPYHGRAGCGVRAPRAARPGKRPGAPTRRGFGGFPRGSPTGARGRRAAKTLRGAPGREREESCPI